MVNKRFYLLFTTFLFFSLRAFADPIVVPVMKSPVEIENPQFDQTGDNFAYTIKNRVFVRNSLTLILTDSFSRNESSNISAFIEKSGNITYPKATAVCDGKKITILNQKSKTSSVEKRIISDLPVSVKAAAVNKKLTTLAFLGNDGKAYVYDLDEKKIVTSFNYHLSTSDIFVTYDNKIVVADTEKTAGMFNLAGQKVKTFTSAGTISAIELSEDNETLVIADASGNINFYNANTASQIGYSPVLGTKKIKQVKLSPDSSKMIVTGRDGSLCIVSTIDVLFAPNTLAQEIKQFDFSYSQIDPTKKDEIVKEFLVTDDIAQEALPETEYITTTQEKAKNTQKFVLDEDTPVTPPVVLPVQPEQAYFPPTVIDADKEVTLSNKADIEELSSKVTEYKAPEQAPAPVVPVPVPVPSEPKATVKETKEPEKVAVTPVVPAPVVPAVVPAPPAPTVYMTNLVPAEMAYTAAATEAQEPAEVPAVTTKKTKKSKKTQTVETPAVEEAKEPLEVVVKEPEEKPAETVEVVEEPEKETEVKTEKISITRDWKRIRKYDDEDIKTLFKDGHGVIVNVGIHKVKNITLLSDDKYKNIYTSEPFPYEIDTTMGYRNYNLIRPFYFGGTLEPTVCITSDEFPYKYYTSEGKTINPVWVTAKAYAPIGICMYPLKNSLEVYAEIGVGASANMIWNGSFGAEFKRSSIQPAFYGNLKVGAAWDFINLSLCGSYDAIVGLSFGVELGALINIDGTRTIGSLMQK